MEPEPHRVPIRFNEIDLLRFLAAFSVVLYHYTFFGEKDSSYNPLVFEKLDWFTRYGYLGVQLFFIISGYVVLLSAQGKTVRQFFVSRIIRLYPAYWVACTLTFLVKIIGVNGAGHGTPMSPALHATVGQYIYNMTMLQDLIGIQNMDGPYWSLAIELTFYFLIAILIANKLLSHIDWFLTGWLLYAGLPHLPYSGPLFTTLFIRGYAPYFIAGMLFYLTQQPRGRRWWRYLLLLGSYVLAMRNCAQSAVDLSGTFHTLINPRVAMALVSGFFVLFYLISRRWLNLTRFTWLTGLGSLTYPLYLLHNDIGFIVFHYMKPWLNKYLLAGGVLTVMLVLSYLIHTQIEKRYSRLLGGWVNRQLQGKIE